MAARRPNDLQASLSTAAAQLPTAGADPEIHAERLASLPAPAQPVHPTVADAATSVAANMRAFTGGG